MCCLARLEVPSSEARALASERGSEQKVCVVSRASRYRAQKRARAREDRIGDGVSPTAGSGTAKEPALRKELEAADAAEDLAASALSAFAPSRGISLTTAVNIKQLAKKAWRARLFNPSGASGTAARAGERRRARTELQQRLLQKVKAYTAFKQEIVSASSGDVVAREDHPPSTTPPCTARGRGASISSGECGAQGSPPSPPSTTSVTTRRAACRIRTCAGHEALHYIT